jgi:hypothetical protein
MQSSIIRYLSVTVSNSCNRIVNYWERIEKNDTCYTRVKRSLLSSGIGASFVILTGDLGIVPDSEIETLFPTYGALASFVGFAFGFRPSYFFPAALGAILAVTTFQIVMSLWKHIGKQILASRERCPNQESATRMK